VSEPDCLFCKIAAHEIPATIAYEDPRLVAFADLRPQAPLHLLIIPKTHIATLNDLRPEHDALVGEMMRKAATLAKEHGYDSRGFRTVFNTNGDAGQTVFHIHLHLLAGRSLSWPPG
jgi:histidine triad (HIT) family protein